MQFLLLFAESPIHMFFLGGRNRPNVCGSLEDFPPAIPIHFVHSSPPPRTVQ